MSPLVLNSIILLVTVSLIIMLIYVRLLHQHHRQKIRQYENELNEKAAEMSQIVEELRRMQIKLMESGKISAVASLSAGILHQVSQPITAIHGFARFMKKEMDPKNTFYKPVCLIEEQSEYLKEMLTDLMELVRHREIVKTDIDINDIMYRAVNLLKDELRIQRVNWDLDLYEHLPKVYGDGIHIQQIFMNIIINAMQAMTELPRGSDKFITIVTAFDKVENFVEITIADTGPGISLVDQERIFEPFYSSKTKGAGIGLALVKDLIAEHSGRIIVESHPKKGAKFMIRLPAKMEKTDG